MLINVLHGDEFVYNYLQLYASGLEYIFMCSTMFNIF